MAKKTDRRTKTKVLPAKVQTLTAKDAKKVKGGMGVEVRGSISSNTGGVSRGPAVGTPHKSFGSK